MLIDISKFILGKLDKLNNNKYYLTLINDNWTHENLTYLAIQ